MQELYEKAGDYWKECSAKLDSRPWRIKLNKGELGLAHYKGFLIETYHNAGLNPQLQGYATLFVTDKIRDTIKKFFQHAISEIGHDLLALDDLKALGVPEEMVVKSNPLPATRAFFSNAVYRVQKSGPSAYLAYLFHLEFSPVTQGPGIMAMLKSKGIPDQAMTFLHEHSTVDVNHLKLMRTYLNKVVNNVNEEKIFFECLSENVFLHNLMLEGAYENGERLFANSALGAVS